MGAGLVRRQAELGMATSTLATITAGRDFVPYSEKRALEQQLDDEQTGLAAGQAPALEREMTERDVTGLHLCGSMDHSRVKCQKTSSPRDSHAASPVSDLIREPLQPVQNPDKQNRCSHSTCPLTIHIPCLNTRRDRRRLRTEPDNNRRHSIPHLLQLAYSMAARKAADRLALA
jgi:hypothetical protein